MKRPVTPRQLSMWSILLSLVLIAAACGGGEPASEPADEGGTGEGAAAEGDPIVVGALFDLSGATSDVGVPYSEGIRAYVEWINGNGGVGGREIDLHWQDYAYDVAQAEQLYSQYISEGAVAIQGWGTGDTEALRTRVASDEVPFMSASYSANLIDPAETPYNFVVALSYSDQMRVGLQYVADQAEGPINVTVFHHDSPFGESPLEDGRAYIEENGLDINYQTIAMPSGATDFIGELTQAQDADYIFIQNVASPAAQLARDVAAQGMDATIVCLNWCGDELFIELAGDAAEGALGVLPWSPPALAEGDMENVTAYLESAGQSLEDINLHFTQGWYTMDVMATGIANVVESGEEVTGAAIKEALEAMEPIDTPVSQPIEFTDESHAGMQAGLVYEVQDGTWVTVSDVIEP